MNSHSDFFCYFARNYRLCFARFLRAFCILLFYFPVFNNPFYSHFSRFFFLHLACSLTVKEGIESALGRKEQANRRRKIDGTVEAHIVAIACSEAPEGRERWTLQLIADELVRLGVVESISDTAVGNTLKKTNLSLGRRKNGVSPSRERGL